MRDGYLLKLRLAEEDLDGFRVWILNSLAWSHAAKHSLNCFFDRACRYLLGLLFVFVSVLAFFVYGSIFEFSRDVVRQGFCGRKYELHTNDALRTLARSLPLVDHLFIDHFSLNLCLIDCHELLCHLIGLPLIDLSIELLSLPLHILIKVRHDLVPVSVHISRLRPSLIL